MSNSKLIRNVNLTAWLAGFGAAMGLVFSVFAIFWTTLVLDNEFIAADWMISALGNIVDVALTGTVIFLLLDWIDRKDTVEEKPVEIEKEPVTGKMRQFHLWLLSFILLALVV